MKCRTAEWITTLKRLCAAQIQRKAHTFVILARLQSYCGAAGCQRQTCAVINCSARNQTSDIEHALVVLVSVSTVGLETEVGFDGIFVGGKNLDVEENYKERQSCDTQPAFEISDRLEERGRGRPVSLLSTDRTENAESREVGKHRRTAIAQERRDDSSQRNYSKTAGNHDETGDNQKHCHRRREKKAVIIGRASGDAESARRNHRVNRNNQEESNEPEFLANGRQDEIGVAGGQITRVPEAETRTKQTAARQTPDGLSDLISSAYGVVPWRQPHLNSSRQRRGNVQRIAKVETENQNSQA